MSGVDEVEDGTEGPDAREAFGRRTSGERVRPDLAKDVGDQDDEDGAHVDRYGLEVTERWKECFVSREVRERGQAQGNVLELVDGRCQGGQSSP